MVLLSAELMVDCFCCVSRGVRGACYKKLSIFLPKKSKKHAQIKNPKHFFFDGFKNHFFFSPKEARYYFLSQKNITKDVSQREEKEEILLIDTQSRVWNGRGFYFSFVFSLRGGERNAKTSSFLGR